MAETKVQKADVIFIDLDDTIITTESDAIFPKGIWDMKFKPNILKALKDYVDGNIHVRHKLYIFIVSNQAGIELGFVDKGDFLVKLTYVERAVLSYLKKTTIVKDIVTEHHICVTNDINSVNRKPNCEGIRARIESQFKDIDYNAAIMIGDASGLPGNFSNSDKLFAENLGVKYYDVNEFINKFMK